MNDNIELLLKQGEDNSFWVLGDLYTFKVTGKQTNETLTIIDQIIQPEGGPPPHIHYREDESFYVLDGKFSFLCGDKQSVLEAGSFAYIPKGTLHTFKNIEKKQGRLLVIITPAGLENFFYSIGTPASGVTTPPPVDPAIIENLIKLAKDYQTEIILPDMK
ncbi:MAG TPA: quercetin 2,3-dioxygenase [Cytophagales bacterium]|nr:quercetin 2,3-dioxygenase [Cytophagales bacterium]